MNTTDCPEIEFFSGPPLTRLDEITQLIFTLVGHPHPVTVEYTVWQGYPVIIAPNGLQPCLIQKMMTAASQTIAPELLALLIQDYLNERS